MAGKVLVVIDQAQATATNASWEALGAGRSLAADMGGSLAALVVGHQVESIAQQALAFGADEAILAEDPALADFLPEPYASVVSSVARQAEPAVLLFPTSGRSRELAGQVAIDLETGVSPDAVGLAVEDGTVMVTRPIYAGKLLTKEVCARQPHIITLRGRAFAMPTAEPGRGGSVTSVEVNLGEVASQVIGYKESEAGVSLTDAGVIVSGGRGVSNNPKLTPPPEIGDEKQQEIWRAQQGFKQLGELAQALGAALGASRAAVDAGYIPYVHQVGQTGKVVSPDLYIACGISGAIQHLAGMRTAKTIVAINKDPEAPIFKLARFGVVGDLHDIVPELTKALQQRLA